MPKNEPYNLPPHEDKFLTEQEVRAIVSSSMTNFSGNFRIKSGSVKTDGGEIIHNFGEVAGWDITSSAITSPSEAIILDSENQRIKIGISNEIILDGANKRITVGASAPILIDGANKKIESGNYVSGYLGSGFHIDEDNAEFGNIACRGIFRSAVLQYDNIFAYGGNQIVAKGADVLKTTMTAADNSTVEIENDSSASAWAVGDILKMDDATNVEWFEIVSVAGNVYTCNRDKKGDYGAGANPAWEAGAAIVNFGQSGDGVIYTTASEANAPYLSILTTEGSPWTDLITRLRLGNLNGFLGEGSDVYGLAVGETGKYLKYDPTNGLRIKGDVEKLKTYEAGENITAGDAIAMGIVEKTEYSGQFTHDSYVQEANPDINYNDTWLYLKDDGGAGNKKWAYLKFNVNDASYPKQFNRVFLRIYINSISAGNGIQISPVTVAWDESTVTWNNKPAANTNLTINSANLSTGWQDIDITPLYCALSSGYVSNHGIRVMVRDGGTEAQIFSTEQANPPKIVFRELHDTGKIYKARNNYPLDYYAFVGFADNTATSGNDVDVKIGSANGIIGDFSGLTVGSAYFLGNTAGSITGVGSGTRFKVGLAISATEISFNKQPIIITGTRTNQASGGTSGYEMDKDEIYITKNYYESFVTGVPLNSFLLKTFGREDYDYSEGTFNIAAEEECVYRVVGGVVNRSSSNIVNLDGMSITADVLYVCNSFFTLKWAGFTGSDKAAQFYQITC